MNANESVLQRHVVNLSQGKWLEERRISARFRCGGTMPRACPPVSWSRATPGPMWLSLCPGGLLRLGTWGHGSSNGAGGEGLPVCMCKGSWGEGGCQQGWGEEGALGCPLELPEPSGETSELTGSDSQKLFHSNWKQICLSKQGNCLKGRRHQLGQGFFWVEKYVSTQGVCVCTYACVCIHPPLHQAEISKNNI